MDQPAIAVAIDLSAQSRHLHVDDVVDRRRAPRLLPDIDRQHLARDHVSLMPQQILEQLELSRRQFKRASTSQGTTRYEVDLQVRCFETQNVGRTPTSHQRPNARQQFRQREWLDQIIVCAEVEPDNAILDSIAGRQNQHRRMNLSLAQGLQDLEATSAREHQVEQHEVKRLGGRAEKTLLAVRCHDDVVMLRLKGRSQHVRKLALVFDDQDAHIGIVAVFRSGAALLTKMSGRCQTPPMADSRTICQAVMRIVLLLGALTVLPASAAGQRVPDAPLTLRAAVDLALRNHPAIREARAAALATSGEIDVAQTAYLPRADLLWQVNRATRNNVFGLLLPQPVIPAVSGPVLGTQTLEGVWSGAGGLLVSWEAIDFGRRRAAVDVAKAESSAAEARRRVTELEIAASAADAFLRVVAAHAAANAAQANVQRLEVFTSSVRTLVENQLRAGAEQSRAEAELAAARNRLIEAERDLELASIALSDAVGTPGTQLTVDADSILQLPAPQPSASFDTALHPRTVVAEAQLNAARARDRALSSSYLPRLELQSAFSARGVGRQVDGSPNGNALAFQVPNWAFGASVTFPAFEIFRTRERRDVEADRLEAATANYDLTVQSLQTQEAQARAITAAAFRIAANTPQQLQAARDTDVQARARYEAGLTSVIEVAEAQRLLAQAEAESAVANLAVWRALLAQTVVRGDMQPLLDLIAATPSKPIQ